VETDFVLQKTALQMTR